MTMQWLNLKDVQPKDGQRVLVWSRKLASFDKKNDVEWCHGVRLGRYELGKLNPDMSYGYPCQWWMPLPEPPKGAK